MRDIREDLLERLGAIEAEMAAAKTQYDVARRSLESDYAALFDDIGERQRAINRILDSESKRMGEPPKRRAPSSAAVKLPLAEFIIHRVAGEGEKTKEDIRDSVERAGYVAENVTAGRMVHTTLLNLVRAGRLRQDGDEYSLPPLTLNAGRYSQAALESAMEDEKEARAEEARIEEGSAAEADEPY